MSMTSSFHRSPILGSAALALALVLGAAGQAGAQNRPNEPERGTREALFARRLAESGHLELAQEVAQAVINNNAFGMLPRGDCAYLLADMARRRMQSAPPDQQASLAAEAQRLLEAARQQFPSHPRGAFAGLDAILAMKSQADSTLQQFREAADDATRQRLLTEARTQYEQVFAQFEAAIQAVRTQYDELYNSALEAMRQQQPTDALEAQLQEIGFRRNYSEYLYCEARQSFAETFARGETGREPAFQAALDAWIAFYSDRPEFFHLWARSFIGAGKCFRELDRMDEALEMLQAVPLVQPPPMQMTPEERAEFDVVVRDIRMEGATELARTYTAMGRPADGIAAIDQIFQQYPNARLTHQGRLCIFEQGHALVAAGRVAEGAMLIYDQVITPSVANVAEHVGDTDLDPYGIAACRALSEILDQHPVIFPGPAQYRAGEGFYFRSRFQEAAWAFKAVAAGCRTPDERNAFVPRALLYLGDCYMRLNRQLEAGIAFEGVPDTAPQVIEALDKARQCYREVMRAHTNIRFFQDLVRAVENRILANQQRGGGGGQSIAYQQAQDLDQRGQLEDAATAYANVQEWSQAQDGSRTRFRYYGEALVNSGACLYRAWRAQRAGQRAPDLIQRATERLQAAIQYGSQSIADDDNDEAALAGGSYWLGAVLMDADNRSRDPAQAAEVLQPFMQRVSNHRTYGPRGLSLLVQALVETGRLDDAGRAYATLKQAHEGSEDQAIAAFFLADWWNREAQRRGDAGEAEPARNARQQAGGYAYDWIRTIPEAQRNLNAYAWAGEILYKSQRYAETTEVYGQMVQRFGPGGPNQAIAGPDIQAVNVARLSLAWSSYLSGSIDPAIEMFRGLKNEFPREYRVLDGYASALFASFRQRYDVNANVSPDDEQRLRDLENAMAEYQGRLQAIGPQGFQALAQQFGFAEQSYEVQVLRTTYRRLLIDHWSRRWRDVRNTIDLRARAHAFDDLVYLRRGQPVSGVITEETPTEVVVKDWSPATGLGTEERRIPRDQVSSTVRFPADLRQAFQELRNAAAAHE